MSLNIKNDEAERLARELVSATGESLTRAVTVALQERLERLQGQGRAEERAARLRRIADDATRRWVPPLRSVDHGELLYDDRGLPR